MKYIYIVACVITLGATPAYAQDPSTNQDNANNADTIHASLETGLADAIFSTSITKSNYGGCSLVKNPNRERKIYNYKNGYKIVTEDKDEIVKVTRQKGGSRKIKYSNDFEDLKYHNRGNGELHYTYHYRNFQCKKVRVHKKTNGHISMKNRTGVESEDAKENVKANIENGVNSCFLVR